VEVGARESSGRACEDRERERERERDETF